MKTRQTVQSLILDYGHGRTDGPDLHIKTSINLLKFHINNKADFVPN